ncbi:hypothetical protein PAXRUDRAFT_827177 [Paxillus rubicundulus Ve08.2h10]|uniref:Uncharacterized protein n=1 Tax=Paxillus rubicundulus Ve08.2h10 TaxID=930991 RepID=A0A0D0DDB3_9AGAM|nr:hypothetical protein PAXRUDRAFT_827177 [Paxillus rubicundulus Ve08.2h10]
MMSFNRMQLGSAVSKRSLQRSLVSIPGSLTYLCSSHTKNQLTLLFGFRFLAWVQVMIRFHTWSVSRRDTSGQPMSFSLLRWVGGPMCRKLNNPPQLSDNTALSC